MTFHLVTPDPELDLVFTDALLPGFRPSPKPFFTAALILEPIPIRTCYTAMAIHGDPDARKTHEDMGFYGGKAVLEVNNLLVRLVRRKFCLRSRQVEQDFLQGVLTSTRNHKSLRRRPLTRRWWTSDLVHTNGSASSL